MVTPDPILIHDVMVPEEWSETAENHLGHTIRPLLVIGVAILIA